MSDSKTGQKDYRQLYAHYDELIRSGQGAKVRTELREFHSLKPPRELLADFANLCRRVGMTSMSLRLLQPTLRAAAERQTPISAKERASYAASLAAIGAHAEAFTYIEPVKNDQTPDVQLYLGYINIFQWNYDAAVPFLKNYLSIDGPSEYQKFVAKLNLASAYSFTHQVSELNELVAELTEAGERNKWTLLTRDSHLLATQGHMITQDWSRAQASLDNATSLTREHSLDDFLLMKWQTLLNLHKDPSSAEQTIELRANAEKRQNYETVRDCDYYLGLLTRKSQLLKKAFFGTPYPSYRMRLKRKTESWLELADSYRWPMLGRHGVLLDLEQGTFNGKGLSSQALSIRILRALSSDFYRPVKVGGLFAAIYADEKFDPFSSPMRVRKALSRTRELLSEVDAPLSIASIKNEYRLIADAPVDLRVRLDYETLPANDARATQDHLNKLKSEWPYKVFTTQQAATLLSLSSEKTRQVLSDAQARGVLIRSGSGRSTLFRFASAKEKTQAK